MILSPYKSSLKRGYVDQEFYIEDTTPTSPDYFDITEFPDYIGGGKSIIKIKGGGVGLKFGSEIEAEVLDVNGDVVYSEFPEFVDKFNNIYLSIYVYDFIAKGVGTISLIGTAQYDPDGDVIPEEDSDSFNLRWTRDILILPDIRNNSILDFVKGPIISFAQIITPFKVTTAYTSSLLLETTSSAINYLTTYNKGYDFDTSTTDDVLDEYLNNILINPNAESKTSNVVPNNTRVTDYDIVNGFRLLENTRFNTYIYTSQSFFRKEYTGGSFSFLTTASIKYPTIPSGTTLTNPFATQISTYRGNIVKVIDEYRALLDKPVTISTTIQNSINNQTSSYIHSKLENFSSSIVYKPIDSTFVTSSQVSQSYVQFTFDDVNPVGGQIYRIKTFYKLSGQTGDYKLLNDQYIKNVEVLADPSRVNQTSYARSEGDFYLLGHFTDIDQVTYDGLNDRQDWNVYKETPSNISQWSTVTSSVHLSDSAQLSASLSDNSTTLFTTKELQAYSISKIYTITLNCVLESGAELEVYGNSFDLNLTTLNNTPTIPRSFIRSENNEKARYGGNYNRFGKFIGSIKNNSNVIKNYGRVAFDFEVDSDGVGRPLFRLKPTSTGHKGWLSEISIKPQLLQGFTPNLIQYPVPVGDDFAPILTQSVDFKFEYYDYTGNQSEFVSYVKDSKVNLLAELPTLGCQADINRFGFEGTYYDRDDDEPMPWGRLLTPDAGNVAYFYGHTDETFVEPGNYQVRGRSIHNWNTTWKERTSSGGSFTLKNTDVVIINTPIWKVTSSWLAFEDTYNLGNANTWDLDYPTGEKAPIDGRYFAYGSSCCIARNDTNTQWSNFTQSKGFQPTTEPERKNVTEALRKVRLLWPHTKPVSTSSFTENGGIYRVFFRVKQTGSYISDSGSKLNVFIHNVNNPVISTTTPYGGFQGNYPPPQNIASITFDSNTQWTDEFTGYKYAQFEVELVQYGTPAQLVFEASGSNFEDPEVVGRTTVQAFGGCIDDIRICKIGVTTDPFYIKPQTDTGNPVNSEDIIERFD